jgi:hypothetical protein
MDFASSYLRTYFTAIDADERAIIRFLVKEYKKIKGKPAMIEIGSGPCIQHVLPIVNYVSSIELTDYLKENTKALKQWIKKKDDAHNWHEFTNYTLSLEKKSSSNKAILNRENKLRNLIDYVGYCDASKSNPITRKKKFGVVGAFYCAEVLTQDKKTWDKVMENITDLILPGGFLFLSAVKATNFYKILKDDGNYKTLPTMYLLEDYFLKLLPKLGFNPDKIKIETVKNGHMDELGIGSTIMISAQKYSIQK